MSTASKIKIPADESRLSEVRDFVTRGCAELGFPARAAANIRLAVDEACTNVIQHAYAEQPGDLEVELGARKGWLDIRILDQGDRFDGRVERPDLGKYVEDRRKGGFGLYLMQRLMDEVRYTSSPNGNVWLLRKRLPRQKAEFGKSLRFRYGLRTAFALLAVTVLACAPLWLREGRERRRSDERALATLAFGLAETARPVLLERAELSPEQTRLFEAVSEVMHREPRLLGVNVVDGEGTVWAADRSNAAFTHFRAPEGLCPAAADGVQHVEQEFESQRVLHLCVPVRVQDARGQTRRLGAVHLSMRCTDTESAIRTARLRIVALALGLYALGTALIAGLLAALLRPVQRLVDGVRSLGSEEALDVDGPGEIGAIAAAFNEINAKYRAARETAAEGERLQKDLGVAQEIQRSILPQVAPEIPGFEIAKLYRPAGQVGGDYYDFLPVNDSMTGIVVADVAGKGVPGSLVMSMIRTALRMEARDNTNAGDVLSRMNTFITADLRKGMFVTMYYVILDSVNRVISYASAGHNPMLLYRARTDESFFLNPKGFPVGLSLGDAALFGKNLDVERLRLQPGDMLVLYTDGITEATNAAHEQYGETRLVQAVKKWGKGTPEEFVRELEADLTVFTGGAPQADDVTLVAIQEKAATAEVHGGVRAKLVDLIERQGVSVDDACRRLKVSPSTYYRFRRSPDPHAAELETQHLSVEKREHLLRLVAARPELGPKELSETLRESRWGGVDSTPSLVHEELRRLELHTPALRMAHAEHARGTGAEESPHHDSRPTPPATPAPRAFIAPVPQPATRSFSSDSTPRLDEPNLRGWITALEGSEDAVLVSLEGSVDSGSCEGLDELLQQAAKAAPHVVVDLSGLAYVSSRGWGLFASDPAGLRARGGEVVLCGMRREVQDVYRMLGFEGVVRAFADTVAAREALHRTRRPASEQSTPEHARQARPGFAVERFARPAQSRTPAVPRIMVAQAPPLLQGLEDLEAEWESLRVRTGAVGPAGEVTLLALEGVLDTVSAYRFQQILTQVIARGARYVVVDLSCTEFVSSAGWGSFTAPLAELRRSGGDLKLFGLNRDLAHIYKLLGLRAVIASFDLLTEALEDFGLGGTSAPAAAGTSAPLPPAATSLDTPLVTRSEPTPAAHPVPQLPAPEPALSATFGGLKARLESFGTTGTARCLHLQGVLRGRNCGELRSWLLEVAAPARLLLVDARAVVDAKPEAWRPLLRYAQSLQPACAVHLIAPESAASPANNGALAIHESIPDALRAYACSSSASLRPVRLPDTEFHKDVELRREGWAAYLELVHSPQWKESA